MIILQFASMESTKPPDGKHNITPIPVVETLTNDTTYNTFSNNIGGCTSDKTDDCECLVQDDGISCPKNKPKLTVKGHRIKDGTCEFGTYIKCHDADAAIYEMLPHVAVSIYCDDKFQPLAKIIITDCPIPQDAYNRIVSKFHLADHVGQLEIVNCRFPNGERAYKGKHFSGLTGLHKLAIVHDEQVDWQMPEDLFSEMLQLREINLQINGALYPPRIFENLRNLQNLKIVLGQFENGPILHQNGLQTFNITNCRFKNSTQAYYERGHFSNLTGLRNLTIIHDERTDDRFLPIDLFDDMPLLRKIDLAINGTQIPPNIFRNLRDLTILQVSLAQFKNVPIFNQSELTTLRIDHCQFENLNHASLANAEDSKWEAFESGAFAVLTNLDTLVLMNNGLTALPDNIFKNSRTLRTVEIYERQLKIKPNQLFPIKNAVRSVILNCAMDSIPKGLFTNSTEIMKIDIQFNQLTTLPIELFSDQSQMYGLRLDHNLLDDLPIGIFDKLSALEFLTLSHNSLTNISKDLFRELTSLLLLNVSNNRLHSIDLNELKSLQVLDLSSNNLSTGTFENCLSNSPLMEDINLRNNSITDITSDWRLLTIQKFLHIDVSYNKINHFGGLKKYYWNYNSIRIDMRHNQISRIDFANNDFWLSSNDSVQVQLNGNPFNCDCYWAEVIKSKKDFMDGWTCAAPSKLEGHPIQSIQAENLICHLDSHADQCANECPCSAYLRDDVLVMNCSNSGLTELHQIPTVDGANSVELHLENNKLTKLPTDILPQYRKVIRIYAKNNSITELLPENVPNDLISIDLSHNQLKSIHSAVVIKLQKSFNLRSLYLAGNPWLCDCNSVDLIKYLRYHVGNATDFNRTECTDKVRLIDIDVVEICEPSKMIYVAIGGAVAGALFAIFTAIYFKFDVMIKVWLFAHNYCLCLITENDLDRDKLHDAFISYSHQDEDFVRERLVPELESGDDPFTLCVHYRDWMPGEPVTTQICESVENSRRTIIILSSHFVQSIWGRMELRVAHSKAMNEGRKRVIVVMYGDIGDVNLLDPELKVYLKSNIYLKWGEEHFFDKLRMAMPRRHNRRLRQGHAVNLPEMELSAL